MEHVQGEPVELYRSNIERALVAGAVGGLVGLMIGPLATLLCAGGAAATHWWFIRRRVGRTAGRTV